MTQATSTILVVDDYTDNRMLLAAWLRAKGYRVIEAQDGKEGVQQANRSNPDLILMDLAMPVLDGIEATRQIRQRRTFSRTPIFAISAYATHDVKDDALAALHGSLRQASRSRSCSTRSRLRRSGQISDCRHRTLTAMNASGIQSASLIP